MNKQIICVSEMASAVGLSRQRFGQLCKSGIFPMPDYHPTTHRPYFDTVKQQQILLVRQTNTGINNKAILFYSKRKDAGVSRMKKATVTSRHDELIESLRCLGVGASVTQVDDAIQSLNLTNNTEETLIPALFRHFKSKH